MTRTCGRPATTRPASRHVGTADGACFRLRADVDISAYPRDVRVILTAMKEYGLILADNGSAWFVSGAPDERCDDDVLRALEDVPGSAFEAVDVSSLIVDPDSGRVAD